MRPIHRASEPDAAPAVRSSGSPGRSKGRRARRRTRGQALVEFALVFPVFILVLAGMVDFGLGLYSYMTIINAAREGARLGATACSTAGCPGVSARTTAMAGGMSPLTVTVTCITAGGVSSSCTTAASSGDTVKVQVDYTYHMIWPLTFGTSIPLSSSVSMMVE